MLEFRRNGRKMSIRQFFGGIKKDMLAKAEGEMEKRLRSFQDSETGQPVKVTKQVQNGKTTWNVEGSAKAIAAAKKIMGAV